MVHCYILDLCVFEDIGGSHGDWLMIRRASLLPPFVSFPEAFGTLWLQQQQQYHVHTQWLQRCQWIDFKYYIWLVCAFIYAWNNWLIDCWFPVLCVSSRSLVALWLSRFSRRYFQFRNWKFHIFGAFVILKSFIIFIVWFVFMHWSRQPLTDVQIVHSTQILNKKNNANFIQSRYKNMFIFQQFSDI